MIDGLHGALCKGIETTHKKSEGLTLAFLYQATALINDRTMVVEHTVPGPLGGTDSQALA